MGHKGKAEGIEGNLAWPQKPTWKTEITNPIPGAKLCSALLYYKEKQKPRRSSCSVCWSTYETHPEVGFPYKLKSFRRC